MSYILGLLFLVACWQIRKKFDDVDETYERVAKRCDERIHAVEEALAPQAGQLRQSKIRLEHLESRVKNHDKASGGFHLCRDKSLVRLRDMSDAHLRHVLHEVQGLEAAAVNAGLLRDELERRRRADLYRQSEDVLARMRASAAIKQVENVSKTLGLRKRQILLQSLEILQKWADSK